MKLASGLPNAHALRLDQKSGCESAGQGLVAPQPGRSWRRLIQTTTLEAAQPPPPTQTNSGLAPAGGGSLGGGGGSGGEFAP